MVEERAGLRDLTREVVVAEVEADGDRYLAILHRNPAGEEVGGKIQDPDEARKG